jgi:hypothetical protein
VGQLERWQEQLSLVALSLDGSWQQQQQVIHCQGQLQ